MRNFFLSRGVLTSLLQNFFFQSLLLPLKKKRLSRKINCSIAGEDDNYQIIPIFVSRVVMKAYYEADVADLRTLSIRKEKNMLFRKTKSSSEPMKNVYSSLNRSPT